MKTPRDGTPTGCLPGASFCVSVLVVEVDGE
jgi:hypothetical protein